jgi:hypothetical protein
MTTNKCPVYHRTSDGRKVVIVSIDKGNVCKLYSDKIIGFIYEYADTLTPWVEPETKTVYVHWKNNDCFECYSKSMKDIGNRKEFKSIKKITITEGEFDD